MAGKHEVGGIASETGFEIVDLQREIVITTEHFSAQPFAETMEQFKTWHRESKEYWNVYIFYASFLSPFLALFVTLSLWIFTNLESPLIVIMAGCVTFFFIVVAPEMRVLIDASHEISHYPAPFKQYHGCEHKVINLLERGWEPTLENLKKASRVHRRCGSTAESLPAQLLPPYKSLLQLLIATREPNEEQLREGLEVAQEYLRLVQESH